MRKRISAGVVAFGLLASFAGVAAATMFDFGMFRDGLLRRGDCRASTSPPAT